MAVVVWASYGFTVHQCVTGSVLSGDMFEFNTGTVRENPHKLVRLFNSNFAIPSGNAHVVGTLDFAQGGIAAATAAGDSPASHAADTITVGGGLVDELVAAMVAGEGRGRIEWLQSSAGDGGKNVYTQLTAIVYYELKEK